MQTQSESGSSEDDTMDCQKIREQLHILSDGERLESRGLTIGVARHTLACADCRAAWRWLKRLRRAARSLPAPAVPSAIKDRVMAGLASLPEPLPLAPARSWRLVSSQTARLAVGVAVAVALVALTTSRGPRRVAVAEVAAAVRQANTWHLKGWRLRGGKRIPWEIWQRRQPFFYREQFGDTLIFDDGRQRVETLPRGEGGLRRALRLSSGQGAQDQWQSPLSMGEGWLKMKPWRETRGTLIFEGHDSGMVNGYEAEVGGGGPDVAADSYYTVDRRTALPIRYEYHVYRQNSRFEPVPGSKRVVEVLDAEYNVPLPEPVTTLRLPEGTQLLDGMAPPAGGSLPIENVQSARGLTAQVTPLAMDERGHVLARVRAWLGSVKLGASGSNEATSPTIFNADIDVRFRSVPGTTDTAFHADDGRPYIHFKWPHLMTLTKDGDQFLLFVPLEPLPKGAALPRTLMLNLEISPGVWGETGSGRLQSKWLFHQEFTWKLALPTETSPIDLEKYAPRNLRAHIVFAEPLPLEAMLADRRAWHYDILQKPDRAIYWTERALAACDPNSNNAQFRRLGLAHLYDGKGDRARAVELLRKVISVSKKHPETWDYYRNLAESSLRRPPRRR